MKAGAGGGGGGGGRPIIGPYSGGVGMNGLGFVHG